MKDQDITELFLKTFIKNKLQERMLYEFSSDKHLQKAIGRLSHNAKESLQMQCVIKAGSRISEREVLDFFPENSVQYYSSRYNSWSELPVAAAIQKSFDEEMMSCIFHVESRRCFLKEEWERDSEKYLLMNTSSVH